MGQVRFGKPCLAGTRIDVATLVGALGAGESVESTAAEYGLTVEQVRAALQADGVPAEHIITIGWRGVPDSKIRARLRDPDCLVSDARRRR